MERIGFGIVEPNHLSAQKTGQIFAQLPCDSSITLLENGQFVKYDYAAQKVNLTGKGEWMLVMNEFKGYDKDYREHYKDYAMKAEDFVDGIMTPRVLKTNIGDIYTTNCLTKANTSNTATVEMGTFTLGDLFEPDATGYLQKVNSATDGNITWQVAKVYTMPDGQVGLKLQRIA